MSALRIIAKCMEPVFCINFHGLMLEKNWKLSQVLRKKRPEDAQNQAELNTSHFFKFCHKINGHPYGTDFTFFCETMFGKLMKIAEKKLPKNPWSTSKGYWKPVEDGREQSSVLVELSCSGIPPASNQGSSKLWAKAFRQRRDVTSFPGVSGISLTYTPTCLLITKYPPKLESRWGIYPPGAQKNAILVAPLLCQALKWGRDWHDAAHVHVMTSCCDVVMPYSQGGSRFWPSHDVV